MDLLLIELRNATIKRAISTLVGFFLLGSTPSEIICSLMIMMHWISLLIDSNLG